MGIMIFWFACGIIAAVIGHQKTGTMGAIFGLALGLLLGPLGILWAVISPGGTRKCQSCQKRVHKKAVKCPYCQSAVPA